MDALIEIAGLGILVPAAISALVALGCRRFLPALLAQRYALSLALAAGYCAGFFFLPSWADWKPNAYWQWLPYLAIAAAAVGPIGLADGLYRWERWLINLAMAGVVAWILVPHWPAIEPKRHWYVISLASYLGILSIFLPAIALRTPRTRMLVLWCASATAVALVAAAFVSLRFGRVAGLTSAATMGCCIASFWNDEPTMVRGLGPTFSILVGGMAFVACIEPIPPAYGILLLPAAPLALWTTSMVHAKFNRAVAIAIDSSAVIVVLLAGIGMVWWVYSSPISNTAS